MIGIDDIKDAILFGNEKGYVLFPEIQEKSIIARIMKTKHGIEMYEQIKDDLKAAKAASCEITYEMFTEFERTGNRLIFETAYFGRRKQLFTLVLYFVLEKDEQVIPIIEQKLWEWCDLYSWELPAHYGPFEEATGTNGPDTCVALFAAESAFFFAEIIHLLGDKLDKLIVKRVRQEIFRRVINPYLSNVYWWETAKMNWSAVCAGSIGAAAIYLIEDTQQLTVILNRVVKSMNEFISAFDSNGLIAEGLSYWDYGFSFFTYFSELLKDRTVGKISLLNLNDKVIKIAKLPQILQYPSNCFVNFSDSGSGKWYGNAGVYAKLSSVFSISGFNYAGCYDLYNDETYRFASMVRKLIWSNTISDECKDVVTGLFWFDESSWIVDRRVLPNNAFTAFASKGGNNDEPHNHNDLGNFILHYGGEDIFIDIGSPEYVKEYFRNETRYDFIAASSMGHSVPVINNKPQSYGKQYKAKVLEAIEKANETHFKLTLKDAYDCNELKVFDREFIWDHEKLCLYINDSFEFSTESNHISEGFITKTKPEMRSKGCIDLKMNGFTAMLHYDEAMKVTVEELVYNNHSGKQSSVFRSYIHFYGNKDIEIRFKIELKI